MTRPKRTPDEEWVLKELLAFLNGDADEWREAEGAPTDRPDATLRSPNGSRVACEFTTISLPDWFRWHRDPRLTFEPDKVYRSSVPREVDLWLEKAVMKKASKAGAYMQNAAATEVWLVVHGGPRPDYDLFHLDEEEHYDIPLLVHAANDLNQPFTRIFAASMNSKRLIQIFPYGQPYLPPPNIRDPRKLKMLTVLSQSKVTLSPGVNTFDFRPGRLPSQNQALPPLNLDRIRSSELARQKQNRRKAARRKRRSRG